jgi:hypothetical protein
MTSVEKDLIMVFKGIIAILVFFKGCHLVLKSMVIMPEDYVQLWQHAVLGIVLMLISMGYLLYEAIKNK